MALTLTKFIPENVPAGRGDVVSWYGGVTFDSSYPTGGELIVASDFGLDEILFVNVGAVSDVATKVVRWIRSTGALQIFIEDGTSGIMAEAANASDQSAVDITIEVVGRDR